jgi:ComEC/Rec2-related protein
LFSTLGAVRAESPGPAQTSNILASSTGAVGRVEAFPRPARDGHRAVFHVTDLCIDLQCVPADETVLLYTGRQDPPISRWQVLEVDWRVQTLAELPSGYRSFVRAHDATATANAHDVRVVESGPRAYQRLAIANQGVADHLAAVLPADTAALATGIVTGDDSDLSDQAMANFRATGTSHITAVSGQNVTIILGFLALWWHPKTILKRQVFYVMLVLVVWSYALFVGLEPPAFRAAIVATFTIVGKAIYRRPDPVTSLSLTLGGMALFHPLMVHGVGFWLSATASAALCLALPTDLGSDIRKRMIEIALGPVAASLATMPIVLATFGTWSPVSILANILIAPVITLAFWVTYPFAILALVFPAVAGVLSWIPGILLDVALVIVDWLAPVAAQIRVDSISPGIMLLMWLPIGAGIWLASQESDRWIRHAKRTYRSLRT